jgi:hypothetical protein
MDEERLRGRKGEEKGWWFVDGLRCIGYGVA